MVLAVNFFEREITLTKLFLDSSYPKEEMRIKMSFLALINASLSPSLRVPCSQLHNFSQISDISQTQTNLGPVKLTIYCETIQLRYSKFMPTSTKLVESLSKLDKHWLVKLGPWFHFYRVFNKPSLDPNSGRCFLLPTLRLYNWSKMFHQIALFSSVPGCSKNGQCYPVDESLSSG